MAIVDKIKQLNTLLYPTGRAFRILPGSYSEKLHAGLAVSEAQAFNDALSILDSALPDNAQFSTDDATDWERRLGLTNNSALSLTLRKAAIQRKMNYGLDIRPRGHYLFLQRELQAAGFDVYVHENNFNYTTKTFDDYIFDFYGEFQHGEYEHGEFEHGDDTNGGTVGMVVNSLYNNIDIAFDVGDNLRSTFFIGGAYDGEFADVDSLRETELRELILKIKPVQTVAYLLINFV